MRYLTLSLILVSLVSCSKNGSYRKVLGSDKTGGDHEYYIVSCCVTCDEATKKCVFPTTVPTSHQQFCAQVHESVSQNHLINGISYIPMTVGCGEGKGYIGDEYYRL